MFQGSIVALVTPMTSTGDIDLPRIRSLIEMHIEAGSNGIVVTGTTGESFALTLLERQQIIQTALEASNRRIPIIVGTGTASTATTLEQTRQAMELGADAALIITPYCNKPTQEGLFQHYQTIAQAVALPIILYNVSTRTSCDLLPETVQRLSRFSNIIGLKEANPDLDRIKALFSLDSFALYSGDDASALAFMLKGGKGVISVTANVAPKAMQEMCQAALEKRFQRAGELNTRLMPLHKNLFVEANPIPVKWALSQLNWIEGGLRLPLTPLAPEHHLLLREAMEASGAFQIGGKQ